jgi:hypothetical protein
MVETDPTFGALLATYPSDRGRLLLPAAIIIGVVGTLLNFTLATVEPLGPPLTIAITAGVSLAAGWRVLHFWNREVILYEKGFTFREGAHTVFFHYYEVKSIRQRAERLAYFGGLLRRTLYRFTITTIRDEKIVLDNLYRRVAQLGERLEARANHILEPLTAARLGKGELVAFSDTLRVNNDGLHQSGRSLTWGDLGGYRIERGQLLLLDRGGEVWFGLPLPDVDNITILLNLLRQRQNFFSAPANRA